MARPSRPPGFDMSYRPAEAAFGPPWAAWAPSLAYATLAIAAVTLVALAEVSPSTSRLFDYFVAQDGRRVLGARAFAGLLSLGAVSALLRTALRGVYLSASGLVVRDVGALSWPRVVRYEWTQIDGIVLDLPGSVALDLWDGRREHLPVVQDRPALERALEWVALARAIPVRGGQGLETLPDPEEVLAARGGALR